MAEQIVNGYKRLFEVRLLHHYWLDEGAKIFDLLPKDDIERNALPTPLEREQPTRERRLLNYDVRPFLSVVPTATTEQRLKGLRCVFKATALGLVVAVPKDVPIPDNTLFEFVVTVRNADFFNYTALTLRKQKIHELYHQAEDKTYRYKENVFLFSNETGTSKSLHVSPSLPTGEDVRFLSRPIPAFIGTATYQIESLVGALHQALVDLPTAAPPSAGWSTIADPTKQPIYAHQDDAPAIVFPSGLTNVPQRGVELTPDLPDDLFALIRIKTLVPTNNPFSLLLTTNLAPPAPSVLRSPIFEIRFKNRSTVWKYYNKTTQVAESNSGGLFPLTYSGNAYVKANPDPTPTFTRRQPPSVASIKVTPDTNDPSKITELISEIFV